MTMSARRVFAVEPGDGSLLWQHEFGNERGPTIRAAKLAQRFVFREGRLAAAFSTRPGADLVFAVDAIDRAGHLGTTRLSFAE